MVLSVSYCSETATPSSPPSPLGTAASIFCSSATSIPSDVVSLPTLSSRLLSRSVTNADPSGRNAIAHGTASPLASTVTDTSAPPLSLPPELDGDGYGESLGGDPSSSGGGGPNEQAPR